MRQGELIPLPGIPQDGVLDEVNAEFNLKEQSEEDHLDYLMTDKQVAALDPIEYVIAEWCAAGNYTYLYGPPGIGKTFLLLDMARSVRAGGEWQGYPVQKGAVIFYQGEGVRQFQKRIPAWDAAFRSDRRLARGVYADKLFDLTKPEQVAAVVRTVRRYEEKNRCGVRLLIIEPLVEYMTGEENGEGMELATRGLRALARLLPKTAVVAGHHTNAAGDRERGAAFLRMRCGAAVRVEELNEDGIHRIGVLQHKQRDGETIAGIFAKAASEDSIVLESVEETSAQAYVARKEGAQRKAGEAKRAGKVAEDKAKLLAAIAAEPGIVTRGLRGSGMPSASRTRQLLDELAADGEIRVQKEGHAQRYFTV